MVKIIVIDDDPLFLNRIGRGFEGRADLYLSDPSHPTQDAIDLARRHPNAYMFLDLFMPDGNGVSAPSTGIQVWETVVNKEKLILAEHVKFFTNHFGEREFEQQLVEIAQRSVVLDKSKVVESIEALILRKTPQQLKQQRRRQREVDEQWYLTDLGLRRDYGGQVVVIHNRRVWGAGDDVEAALAAATGTEGCPPVADLLFAVAPSDLPSHWDLPFRPFLGTPAQPDEG